MKKFPSSYAITELVCYKPGDTGKHLSPQEKEINLQQTGMKRKDDVKGKKERNKDGRLQMHPRTILESKSIPGLPKAQL